MWLMADYLPEVAELDRRIFPAPEALVVLFGGRAQIEVVPIRRDTPDWMLGSFWAHPERVLDERARCATSGFARTDDVVVQRVVRDVRRDLESGVWDERYGHLRQLDAFDAGLRLIVAEIVARPLITVRTLLVLAHGSGCGHRVELIRVVEHECLGGACCLPVVVRRNGVEELGGDVRRQRSRSAPRSGVGRGGRGRGVVPPRSGGTPGPRPSSSGAPDVVEQRCREEEIVAEARMELGGLATQSGHADGVLEKAARVAVVPVRSGGR